jgi:diguanylate cyclase (GGDEF)-like protein/PAS domain S-box-containing protein
MSQPATILVVDDEPQNRKLLDALLRPEGYLTRSAGNGMEALASVAEQAPDLILLDLMMPEMDGYQVASILKASPATVSIPIIMVTANIDRDARLKGLNAGAEDFLTKPVDRAELWLKVRNLLRLKEYSDLLQNQGVILEQKVQERTAELRASELQFRQMAENIRDIFYLVDAKSNRILYVSPAFETISGRSCDTLIASPASWIASIHPEDRAAAEASIRQAVPAGQFKIEYRMQRPDGSIRWIESRGFPVQDDAGQLVRVAGVAKDITEHREAQARIAYLNRVYAVLSGINTLIVRSRDRDRLFDEACRVAVDVGGFRMALVGVVDSGTNKISLAASAGADAELLIGIHTALASDENSAGTMVARAIATKKPVLSNDLERDRHLRMSARLAESGVRSMVSLPLIVSGEAVGALALFAGESEFFHAEEMHLLEELAGDIAFAIDHIEKAEKLNYMAYYDSLTGLANRGLFLERMALHMRSAAAAGHRVAVYLVDLERFKNINDSLGRPAGDSLLLQVAQWLTRNGGDASLFARLDADHFAAILPDIKPEWDLPRILEKSMGAFFEHAFRMNDAVFRISAKVGGAVFPDDGSDADTLFKNAEVALKNAKVSGERYLFYSQTMSERVAGKLTLENQLRQALDNDEFALHYQPKVNLVSGEVTSAEALIRWNDPRTGLVPPGHFIPVLEETGLIYEVGRWALRKAIEDYLRWRRMGLVPVRLAVNVSPLQLRNRGFVAELRQKIGVDSNAAAGLELEITESLIMEDVKHNIASLKAIREMGVSIAIDDFGTGFSSLAYLAKLPVDSLKIDRSFVTDMTLSPEGLALVSTIVSLAHSLMLNVVAEGVETDEQSRLLRLLGCDEMQGYVFSKPVPADIFEARFLSPNEVTKQAQKAGLNVAALVRGAGAV